MWPVLFRWMTLVGGWPWHQAGSTCREQKILQLVCSKVLSVGHEMAWGGMAKWVECSESHTTELGGWGAANRFCFTHKNLPPFLIKDTKIRKLPLPGHYCLREAALGRNPHQACLGTSTTGLLLLLCWAPGTASIWALELQKKQVPP